MSNRDNTSLFAHLPNGIIREIVAYTGATFKCRNGKYMGQIPKNDPRYALLYKIPPKIILVGQQSPYTYFTSTALLFKDDRFDVYTIRLQVSGIVCGRNKTVQFATRLLVCDGNSPIRYYEYDEDNIRYNREMKESRKILDESEDIVRQVDRQLTFWRRMLICSSVYLVYTIYEAVRSTSRDGNPPSINQT